ncbi:MAG: DUF393 domain-containing protein [Fimbriimonadaceae bacterium]|nr:DUF393 domain-containing protein [Fimbriimonadaceae bacterium]
MADHLLIWDGTCGFCAWSVERLMRWDAKTQRIRPVASEACPSPPLTPEILSQTRGQVVLVGPDGETTGGADALVKILELTGRPGLARLARPLLPLLRPGYRLVARNRHRLSKMFFGGKACGLENRSLDASGLETARRIGQTSRNDSRRRD